MTIRKPKLIRAALAALTCILSLLVTDEATAAEVRKSFDIPAGEAPRALKAFTTQSGEQLLYSADAVQGVSTNAIKGVFTAHEALDQMVSGTNLVVVADKKNGALSLVRNADPKAQGPALAAVGSARPEQAEKNPTAKDEEAVMMSPFEVTSANDKGYFAANTMAGTRLNSRVEDLGASITVITKEQMQDFGLLDINDIFAYEANTEGMRTYTAFSALRSTVVSDDTESAPESTNRIRGISGANIMFGNFAGSGRMPVDPINIDSLEISRGPNSSIFGIGQIGGSVNSVPASANLNADKTQLTERVDSYGGYRTTLDINRVLHSGVLAARGSFVYQDTAYTQKPSGMQTTRLNGMVKWKPFKNTQLAASISDYRSYGRRPNTMTPIDGISAWKAAGGATWDPVTQTVYLNGKVAASYTGTVNTDLPNYLLTYAANGIAELSVNPNGSVGPFTVSRSTTATNVASASGAAYTMYSAPYLWLSVPATQPLFGYNQGLSDKSIYNYEKINIDAPCHYYDHDSMSVVTLDQVFLKTPLQYLSAQAAWYHEDELRISDLMSRGYALSAGYSGLSVDVNQRLINGQPNPNFMRPFLWTISPRQTQSPYDQNIYRAQLAYKLDLTTLKGFRRWLGSHTLSAYYEYNQSTTLQLAYVPVITSNNSWIAAGTARGNQVAVGSNPRSNYVVEPAFKYYVGDPGANVQYAPGKFYDQSGTLLYGNPTTGFLNDPVTFGRAVQAQTTGGAYNTERVLKSDGVTLQSHFWNDHIVTTVGTRFDELYTRNGQTVLYNPDGVTINEATYYAWQPGWAAASKGPTLTAGVVARPLSWLGFYFNYSNSFQPQSPATSCVPWDILGNTTGKGVDFGAMLSLFNNKLIIKVNPYKTSVYDARASTVVSRVPVPDRSGVPGQDGIANPPLTYFSAGVSQTASWKLAPLAAQWITQAAIAAGKAAPTGDQLTQQVADYIGVPVAFLQPYPYNSMGEVQDQIGKGCEVEVNFNPTPAWTVKLNATKQESTYDNIGATMANWVNARMKVWTTIVDPNTKQLWYNSIYPGTTQTPASYITGSIIAPMQLQQALEGKNNAQIRKYRANVMTNFRLSSITDNPILKKFNVGGALRWEARGAIGYWGVQQYPAPITQYDPNRPIWDSARTYVDSLVGYRTKLFDRIPAKFQINWQNMLEHGRLQPVQAYPNGVDSVFRIIQPQQFILSATFDL